MDNETFDRLLQVRIGKIQAILCHKSKEYSSDTDRLHNFKIAAKLTTDHITPETALFGMMRKHLVSMIDIIEDTEKSICPSIEMIDEKLGDIINYTILLEALLVERWWNG